MRLVIADDHGVVRGGLSLLLDRQVDMQVVGEAADGAEPWPRRSPTGPTSPSSMRRAASDRLQATSQIKALAPTSTSSSSDAR
jgi:DNA-binding NarL/FixJ family response regulator